MATLKKPLKIERPTQEQYATFMTFCQHHYKVLCDKSFQNTPFAKRCWEELAAILNEMDGPKKTAVRWRETLSNLRNNMRFRVNKKRREVTKTTPRTDNFVDVDLSGDGKDSSVTTLTPKKPYSYMAKLGTSAKTLPPVMGPPGDRFEPHSIAYNSAETKKIVKSNANAMFKNNATERGETKGKKLQQPAIINWRKVYSDFIFCELDRYSDADAQRLKNKLTMVCMNFIPEDDYSAQSSQIR